MKKSTIILSLGMLALGGGLSSCNSFLDTMPDKRTELNSVSKVRELLVSAYPTVSPVAIVEYRTDNVEDNGPEFAESSISMIREGYYWEPVKEVDWDAPKAFWDASYNAISAANQVLKSIEELGGGSEFDAVRGEALLCRAWGHFNMLNVFAQAYNSQTSASDLGVPYWDKPETRIGEVTPRLTVKECYQRIDKDLSEGLALMDDRSYKAGSILFHFNTRAAYAFAAQFYLYYEQWPKAKEYATKSIGLDPSTSLRNIAAYAQRFGTSGTEWTNGYNSSSEPANLMLQATRSLWGRMYKTLRYGHNVTCNAQTYVSTGPWSENKQNPSTLSAFAGNVLSYTSYPTAVYFIQKAEETFVITNVAAQTGQPYVVQRPFTVDRTLLVRAEAEVMLGEYEAAARDLSYWYVRNGGVAATASEIADFYNVPSDASSLTSAQRQRRSTMLSGVAKPLNPRFTLNPGMQYNMMQGVLHARRIDGVHEGTRWDDIKRYGIAITHPIVGGETLTLTEYDNRKAVPIPSDIVSAGIQQNPY